MSPRTVFFKSLLACLLLSCLWSATAQAALLTGLRVLPQPHFTRVIFTVRELAAYRAFVLHKPPRVVVDLASGRMQGQLRKVNFQHSLITAVRPGRPTPDTLRLVFDVSAPVEVKSSFYPGKSSAEKILLIDIYPQEPAPARSLSAAVAAKVANVITPVRALPTETHAATQITQTVTTTTHVTSHPLASQITIAGDGAAAPYTVTRTVTRTTRQHAVITDSSKPHAIVVVIDPGHGGKDTGTIGKNGGREKDIVLAIGQRLADLVNHQPNMRAVLTRDGDYFVTLRNRLAFSRQAKADLFIAIHADSYFNDRSIGASVYALSRHGASSMTARWLADRENHSELGGVDLNELGDKSYLLRSVLIDLAQTATINDSMKLGTNMLNNLENVTALHYPRVEQAPFMVLKSPDIPSVLVETGFLSNPVEEQRLQTAAYRDKLAHAMLGGINRYLSTHPLLASAQQTPPTTL